MSWFTVKEQAEPQYYQALVTDGTFLAYVWVGRRTPFPEGWTLVKQWSLRVPESHFFREDE